MLFYSQKIVFFQSVSATNVIFLKCQITTVRIKPKTRLGKGLKAFLY